MYDKLKVGGFWRVASDHEVYKHWILKLFGQEKFQNCFEMKTFNRQTRPDASVWAETRYEQKAIDDILYVECVKLRGVSETSEKI